MLHQISKETKKEKNMDSRNQGFKARERHAGEGRSLYNSCATTGLESDQCRLGQVRGLSGRDFFKRMKLIEFLMCLNILRDLHKESLGIN